MKSQIIAPKGREQDCTKCGYARDLRRMRPMSPETCTCSLTGVRQVAKRPRCDEDRKREADEAKKKGGSHG